MNVKSLTLQATEQAEPAQTSDNGHCFAIFHPFSHSFSSFHSRACTVCMCIGTWVTALSSMQADEQAGMLARK